MTIQLIPIQIITGTGKTTHVVTCAENRGSAPRLQTPCSSPIVIADNRISNDALAAIKRAILKLSFYSIADFLMRVIVFFFMILILGSSGYLGSTFVNHCDRNEMEFVGLSRSDVDYTNRDSLFCFLH